MSQRIITIASTNSIGTSDPTYVQMSQVTFSSPVDLNPGCTFVVNPPPGWHLAEFVFIRPIRQALISMFVSAGLSLFKVDYS